MAHAAAHLKKARELEQCSEYKALQKAREKRRQQRERAERKRQVKVVMSHLFIRGWLSGTMFVLFTESMGKSNNSGVRNPIGQSFCFLCDLNCNRASTVCVLIVALRCCVWLTVLTKRLCYIYLKNSLIVEQQTFFSSYSTCIDIYVTFRTFPNWSQIHPH